MASSSHKCNPKHVDQYPISHALSHIKYSIVNIAAGLHVLSETYELMQLDPLGLAIDPSPQEWMYEIIRICIYAGVIDNMYEYTYLHLFFGLYLSLLSIGRPCGRCRLPDETWWILPEFDLLDEQG